MTPSGNESTSVKHRRTPATTERYRPIGTLKISGLGIGGLHFGNLCDETTTTAIIHAALDRGVNFIDTAPMYGNACSEEFIGRAIRGRRHDVVLATKVGLRPSPAPDGSFGVAVAPLTPANIRAELDRSLRTLKTDYIDLYQVHAFDATTPVEETMTTLRDLVKEGKVRALGCSNYLHGELRQAAAACADVSFASFQAHYNLIERRAEAEVFPECREFGAGVLCNRPLARGILTGKYRPARPLPEGSRAVSSHRIRRWLSEDTLRLVATLDNWAAERGRSITELAIAWLLAQPLVASVLTGMRTVQQVDENVRAMSWTLTNDELQELDAIIEAKGLSEQVQGMPETLFEM